MFVNNEAHCVHQELFLLIKVIKEIHNKQIIYVNDKMNPNELQSDNFQQVLQKLQCQFLCGYNVKFINWEVS